MGDNNKDINTEGTNSENLNPEESNIDEINIDDILNTKGTYISESERIELERQIMSFDPMKKKWKTDILKRKNDSSVGKSAAERSMERQILDFDPTKLQEKKEVDLEVRKTAPRKESFTEILANYGKKKDINDRESMSRLSEKDFSKADIEGEFWKADYKETSDEVRTTTRILKFIIPLIVIAAIVVAVIAVINSRKKNDLIDVSKYVESSEDELAKEFGLTFSDNKEYAAKTGLERDLDVSAKMDQGFAVIYDGGTQIGIFIDSADYSLFGFAVGDPCDETFKGLKYGYTDVKKKNMGRLTRTKTDYFLYSTSTGDCVYISIDDNTGKIKELGYYYDYKLVIN